MSSIVDRQVKKIIIDGLNNAYNSGWNNGWDQGHADGVEDASPASP
jgi:hypothetical protein